MRNSIRTTQHLPWQQKSTQGLALAVAVLFLVGCAVGPNFRRPAAPAVKSYTSQPLPSQVPASTTASVDRQRFAEGVDIPAEWWQLFHSEQLNSLIEQALKANHDLKSAQAALRVAVENVRAQRGAYYPNVQASFSASRQQNAVGTLAPTLNSGAPIFNLFTPQVSVSYLFDVFGVSRRQVEALAAQEESQRFQVEATHLTLTSNLASAAIQEAALRAQIAATEKVIGVEQEALAVLKKSLSLGAIPEADVVAQEAALAQAQASLPTLSKQLEQQRVLMSVLVGRFPDDPPPETFDLADIRLPADLPVGVPSKLIEQRPDVRSAEAQMHAASAQVGVAIGNLLPQVTLSAVAGSAATATRDLFVSGNNYWSGGATLTQTLFAGGMVWHRKRAADAALDQAGEQYRGVVLSAFQNVADALLAVEHDGSLLEAQLRAERAAAASLEIARQQVSLGSTSYLALLSAQQVYQQAVIGLAQAQAARYADTVALFQALGGGWWNRSAARSAALTPGFR
jgi:NodT family efflux transporter outer membrane factor (OMF) lipoprotein